MSKVVETSTLVNFLRIDRMDLLRQYSEEWVVTELCCREISDHYSEQQPRFEKALRDRIVIRQQPDNMEILEIFGRLPSSLGNGEKSSIAYALHHGHELAIDDSRAIRQAQLFSKTLVLLCTEEIMTSLIQRGCLTEVNAHDIFQEWERALHFKISLAAL